MLRKITLSETAKCLCELQWYLTNSQWKRNNRLKWGIVFFSTACAKKYEVVMSLKIVQRLT